MHPTDTNQIRLTCEADKPKPRPSAGTALAVVVAGDERTVALVVDRKLCVKVNQIARRNQNAIVGFRGVREPDVVYEVVVFTRLLALGDETCAVCRSVEGREGMTSKPNRPRVAARIVVRCKTTCGPGPNSRN